MLLVLKRSKCSLKETKLRLWLLKMTCKCVNGRIYNCHFLEVAPKGNWERVRWQLASLLHSSHWALEPDTSNFSIISRLLSSSQVQPPWRHLMCQVQWCLLLLLRLFPSRKSPPLLFFHSLVKPLAEVPPWNLQLWMLVLISSFSDHLSLLLWSLPHDSTPSYE